MSEFDLMTTTALPPRAPDLPNRDAIRAELIGNRRSIGDLAAAFDVTERTIYNAIAHHSIPYVKVFNVRYLDPADLHRALIAGNTAPRTRGRPTKAR
jgi:hypothetical protein